MSDDVGFDLELLDLLAAELDRVSSALGEECLGLYAELRAADVSTAPARRVGEVAGWCSEAAAEIRERARLVRAAEQPIAAADSGGFGGWLSDRRDDVVDSAVGLGSGALDVAGDVLELGDDVVDGAGDVLDATGGWAVGQWDAALQTLDDLGEQATQTFDGVLTWAQETAGGAVEWATGAVEWADGALDDAGAWVDRELADVRDWIGGQAALLRGVADAATVAGLALVGVAGALAAASAVFGPFTAVPAGAVAIVGLSLWGLGEVLDTTVEWGEGTIDGRALITGLAVDVASALVIGKLVRIAAPVLEPVVARLRHWIDDVRGPRPDAPELPPVGPVPRGETLPGTGRRLEGGTVDDPVPFDYRNPAEQFRDRDRPSPEQTRLLGPHRQYASGTSEHMDSAWRDYLGRPRVDGNEPWTWERWRANYTCNQGNAARGRAYEEAFRTRHGFTEADGWSTGTSTPVPGGGRRDFDIVDEEDAIAYELKSGDKINPEQLAKDRALVDFDWTIIYVFGREPSAAARRQLDDAGIRVEVWVGQPRVTN